jgi:hypothetical protein
MRGVPNQPSAHEAGSQPGALKREAIEGGVAPREIGRDAIDYL